MTDADKKMMGEVFTGHYDHSYRHGSVLAELTRDVEMRKWNGHDTDPEFTPRLVPAGTTVMIWTASRFGDIGINDRLDAHGYDARVNIESVCNLRKR